MCLCCAISETLKMCWNIGCKKWFFFIRMINSSWVAITVIFFLFLVGVFFYKFVTATIKDITHWLAILLTSFGSIFIALKYKLDRASYHKNLFEERYTVFSVINKILLECFQEKDEEGNVINWRSLIEQLNSVYRKSYFLFGAETYAFMNSFRQAVIDYSCLRNSGGANEKSKAEDARKFLIELIDGQQLAEKFPELKIDFY